MSKFIADKENIIMGHKSSLKQTKTEISYLEMNENFHLPVNLLMNFTKVSKVIVVSLNLATGFVLWNNITLGTYTRPYRT